jgi:hypothetical protein
MAYKGRYKPNNPEKYRGDPTKIIYRSLWERRFMVYCDSNSAILEWSSEEVVIPYKSPIDNKIHRYFPDFLIKVRDKNGNKKSILIEVKPKAQTKPPDPKKKYNTPSGRLSRRFINEVKTYAVNEAKWLAAEEYCADRKWEFMILTEDQLVK